MFDKFFINKIYNIIIVIAAILLLVGIPLLLIYITTLSKPENNINQITCFEKEVYVLGKGNVSCILCRDSIDNYMSCDYDRVNRSLKGVFYR